MDKKLTIDQRFHLMKLLIENGHIKRPDKAGKCDNSALFVHLVEIVEGAKNLTPEEIVTLLGDNAVDLGDISLNGTVAIGSLPHLVARAIERREKND